MTNSTNTFAPEPVDKASSEKQTKEEDHLEEEIETSQQLLIAKGEYDLPGALQGIAAMQPRALGGALSATLLMQHLHALSEQIAELRRERDASRESNDQLREQLHNAELRVVRLESFEAQRPLKNAAIVVGTILAGAAITLGVSDYYLFAAASGLLGLVLLYFGIRRSPTPATGAGS